MKQMIKQMMSAPSHSQPFDLTDLSPYFQLPEKVVAKELGICLTSLKKLCRQQGINRWPYRKVRIMFKFLFSLVLFFGWFGDSFQQIKSLDKKLKDLGVSSSKRFGGRGCSLSPQSSSPPPSNSDGSDASVATTPRHQDPIDPLLSEAFPEMHLFSEVVQECAPCPDSHSFFTLQDPPQALLRPTSAAAAVCRAPTSRSFFALQDPPQALLRPTFAAAAVCRAPTAVAVAARAPAARRLESRAAPARPVASTAPARPAAPASAPISAAGAIGAAGAALSDEDLIAMLAECVAPRRLAAAAAALHSPPPAQLPPCPAAAAPHHAHAAEDAEAAAAAAFFAELEGHFGRGCDCDATPAAAAARFGFDDDAPPAFADAACGPEEAEAAAWLWSAVPV
jgi:hypothetical protein